MPFRAAPLSEGGAFITAFTFSAGNAVRLIPPRTGRPIAGCRVYHLRGLVDARRDEEKAGRR